MFIVFVNVTLVKTFAGSKCKTIAYTDDASMLFRLQPTRIADDLQTVLGHEAIKTFGLVVNVDKMILLPFSLS